MYTSRGPIGRVGATWNVKCVERDVTVNNDNGRVNLLEDFVDGTVVTLTILPTLNHSLVVSMDDEVPYSMARVVEVAYQTLEANSFCPSDILLSMESLPSWNKPPGPPPTQDNDGNSEGRACIRECANVEQLNRGRDGLTKGGPLQEGEPWEMPLLVD